MGIIGAISDIVTNKLKPQEEYKPTDVQNLDWSKEISGSGLESVPVMFNISDVQSALDSKQSPLLKSSNQFSDLQQRRAFLVEFINELLASSHLVREALTKDYKFQTTTINSDVEGYFAELQKINRATYLGTLKRYHQERIILIKAFEQALSLIQNNPLLKELVSLAVKGNGNQPINFDSLYDQLAKAVPSLPVVTFSNKIGFNGNKDNHGTLVFDKRMKKVELHLDGFGKTNLAEIIHEYAAFLIMSKFRTINSPEVLASAKHTDISYTVMCIDLLSASARITKRFINL